MRKPQRKTLIAKLDKVCSRIVRARGACAKCGASRYESLQAAHIYSRNFKSVRWNLDNLVCLCQKCHWEAHLKPLLWVEWIQSYLPEYKYVALKHSAGSLKKWTVYELEELLGSLERIANGGEENNKDTELESSLRNQNNIYQRG